MVKSFRELEIWKKAIILVKELYLLTEKFPKQEMYGLISQIRSAAVSIPSNIAEGHIRNSTKEFQQFLSISLSSLAELETQLIIAREIGYVSEDELNRFIAIIHEIGRMNRGLHKSLLTPNP